MKKTQSYHVIRHPLLWRGLGRLFIVFLLSLLPFPSLAQGLPFIRNYTAKDYMAHNRNFDIIANDDGTLFVANFEGLLYYDNAEWNILHTPGITRITDIFKDSKGTIWTGGYNYIGRVVIARNGVPQLQATRQHTAVKGEVDKIWEENGKVFFLVGEKQVYSIEGDSISLQKHKSPPKEKTIVYSDNQMVMQVLQLDNGLKAVATNGNGIIITDVRDNKLFGLTEANGLCSNNVIHISYDGSGLLWGATDNGIFAVRIPSAYSHFSEKEGLHGEVQTIQKFNHHYYVGTLSGLYWCNGMQFQLVNGFAHACYDLQTMAGNLLAATSNGLYCIQSDGKVTQLTDASTMTLHVKDNTFYSGELNGLYLNDLNGMRQLISHTGKVIKIFEDEAGCLWVQNLYGQIWKRKRHQQEFELVMADDNKNNAATIVDIDGKAVVIDATATEPFPYPQFSHTDKDGITWLTDNEGKNLYAWKDGKRLTSLDQLLYPLSATATRSMLVENKQIWLGGDNGLTLISRTQKDPIATRKPRLLIRSIVVTGDSVLWGGFGECPKILPLISRDHRNIRFTFALDRISINQRDEYRYRVAGEAWSAWSTSKEAVFFNQPGGSYTLEVQARDDHGRLSEIVSIDYVISHPFYMRWYMVILYIILLIHGFNNFSRWRVKRVEKEKMQLERLVQERTTEVVKQRDEIEEKSKRLETALAKLSEAQNELIRQEKMATVGKLTQGLIDRILNPLNYINNFAKLSEGLVKDLEANIEDDKEVMAQENYEDTIDVLSMLHGNLQKVSEHGQNTTRTLKAMEEMLKDRSGGIIPMDLTAMLKQDRDMLLKYYEKDINQYHIQTDFDLPDQPLRINGNAEQLSKAVMSMLGNAVYAVVKKAQRQNFPTGTGSGSPAAFQNYQPAISLSAKEQDGKSVCITIHDNGVGIEEGIVGKLFDPFFTTKTTGEASGVGLYLSREIVQNHGGDINVKSVKNDYSEFSIILPALTE